METLDESGAPGFAREVIRTAGSPRCPAGKKMARDGPSAFESAPLGAFLAESGRGRGRAGLAGAVLELADADAHRHLPAISSALATLADDSDEFAGLVARVDGKVRGDPDREQLGGALAGLAAGRPGSSVRLARRLIRSGAAYPAAFLVGGAWRDESGECAAIADSLARSKGGEEAAAGIMAMRVARKMHGIADAAAWIEALSAVASRPDGAAAADAMDALADVYPEAREAAGPLIEGLARRHAACRGRLAARIGIPSSPFDDATAARYLAMCAEGEPGPRTMDSIHMAAADLAKRDPGTAIGIIARRVFDMYPDESLRYALQEGGRADPGGMAEAILGKADACRAPARDTALPFIARDIARHADPEEILGPLFAALDREGAACRPALCMIKGVVSHNHDTARDAEQASRTLRRLVRHAKARGIDAERLAKKEHGMDLKCAAVLDRLLHPPPATDAGRALKNLDKFPVLKKAFGPKWVKDKASEESLMPHPLVARLSDLSDETFELCSGMPAGELCTMVLPKAALGVECDNMHSPSGLGCGGDAGLACEPVALEDIVCPTALPPLPPPAPGCGPGAFKSLAFLTYLDAALALLDAAGLRIAEYVKKMKNPDQSWDTVSEIAFVAPFAGSHGVEHEPSAAGSNRLDAAIDLGPQRVRVEVLAPRMWRPLDLLVGGRGVPGGRVPGKIFDKVREQIPPLGTCSDPVVVAVDTGQSESTWCDVANWMLGPRTCGPETGGEARGEAGAAASARDDEVSVHRCDHLTDSISAVACFETDMSACPAAAVKAVIIENPHAAVPLAAEVRDEIVRILRGVLVGGACRGGAYP